MHGDRARDLARGVRRHIHHARMHAARVSRGISTAQDRSTRCGPTRATTSRTSTAGCASRASSMPSTCTRRRATGTCRTWRRASRTMRIGGGVPALSTRAARPSASLTRSRRLSSTRSAPSTELGEMRRGNSPRAPPRGACSMRPRRVVAAPSLRRLVEYCYAAAVAVCTELRCCLLRRLRFVGQRQRATACGVAPRMHAVLVGRGG